jgi:hypothetical protein
MQKTVQTMMQTAMQRSPNESGSSLVRCFSHLPSRFAEHTGDLIHTLRAHDLATRLDLLVREVSIRSHVIRSPPMEVSGIKHHTGVLF